MNMKCLPFWSAVGAVLVPCLSALAQTSYTTTTGPTDEQSAAACAACGGCGVFGIVIVLALIALNIILLIWVARDAKSRGMDNSVMWMLLVAFTGLIGLVIYFFSRPSGTLVECPNCKNKRLQSSTKCPHCGAP